MSVLDVCAPHQRLHRRLLRLLLLLRLSIFMSLRRLLPHRPQSRGSRERSQTAIVMVAVVVVVVVAGVVLTVWPLIIDCENIIFGRRCAEENEYMIVQPNNVCKLWPVCVCVYVCLGASNV